MSFILDALKKAERERHLTRIPTLATVHSSALGGGLRVGLWVAGAVLLVGGGLSVWYLRPSPSPAPPVAKDSRTSIETAPPAPPAAPEAAPAPPPAVGQPPASVTPAPPPPTAGQQPEPPRQPSREPAASAQPTPAAPRQTSEPAGAGAPKPGEPAPIRRSPNSSGAVARPTEPLPPPPTEPGAGAEGARPSTSAPLPPATPPGPPPLHDAMAKMKLDIFVYTDVPADRMVIINGHKYVEGELVDGVYLLERITREGAILSYQGERVVLRP